MTSPASIPAGERGAGPLVRTAQGVYQGAERDGSFAFLGMPFAAPPIGPLRFAAPAPAPKFDGVRQARQFGATPQRRPWGPDATIPEYVVPGDSTLNVNVFTPVPGDTSALLPVYVWIHGGGYFSGSPACPWYDGAAFNRDGVVTVSISYRLGFDGFGWIADAPLNRGVMDQIAALTWVAENIRQFGGDPDNVTVGGQSAGGGSVMTLLAAPSARGLFHRAIAHSPAVSRASAADAEEAGRLFADVFGVTPDRNGWSSVPEMDIVAREREYDLVPGSGTGAPTVSELVSAARTRGTNSIDLVFAPIQDGVVVHDLERALQDGSTSHVELLIGSTRDEVVDPADPTGDDVFQQLSGCGVSGAALDAFKDESDRLGGQRAQSLLLTSQLFRAPLTKVAALRNAAGDGDRTWLFDFAYHSPVNGCATHGYDVPFAWDLLDAEGVAIVLGETPPQTLADVVHGAWTRFITTGKPGWSPVSTAPHGAMRFDEESTFTPRDYALDAELAGVLQQ